MSQKNKNFKPFICIESVGVFPFEDSSILLINQNPATQQTDYNGNTIGDLVKEKKIRSWQSARNRFPGDVRNLAPAEILSFWNEKKLNGHFKQEGENYVESLIPFISLDEGGVFRISAKFHEILSDLEKNFSGRMLLVYRDQALHMVMEESEKRVFLKTGNVSFNDSAGFSESEPLWVIPLEPAFFKLLRNKNPLKLEFKVEEKNLFVKNTGTGKEQSLDLKPAKSSFNFASRWNPPEEGPLIETVVTKDVMEKLRDISINSSYKRLGFIGENGRIQAALFGETPNDFFYLGSDIGVCKTEFKAVSHPMPLLADDYIVSLYSNDVLRLRSLTQDYEWMTFFENEYSQMPVINSQANNPPPAEPAQKPVQQNQKLQPTPPQAGKDRPPNPNLLKKAEQVAAASVKNREMNKTHKSNPPQKNAGFEKPKQ